MDLIQNFVSQINDFRDGNILRCEYSIKWQAGQFQCENEAISGQKYCVFHDEQYWKNDPMRHEQAFNDKFNIQLPRVGTLHLVGYHLPQFTLSNKSFPNNLFFDHAIFHGKADFTKTSFAGNTSFSNAIFEKDANFFDTVFSLNARYLETQFKGNAYFGDAKFYSGANFYGASFYGEVGFRNTLFTKSAFFSTSSFSKKVDFVGALFEGTANFSNVTFTKCDLSHVNFQGEVEFFYTNFPKSQDPGASMNNYEVPIKFDYSTFRNRIRFVGKPQAKIDLSAVSFTGVDLSNVEFHNVKWLKAKFPTHRNMIINEYVLKNNGNYEEVTKIYNQLRKNYESKLLFNEASDFFVGELESIRKSLMTGTKREKILSIPYAMYKVFALYGESAALPLLYWSPTIILGLFLVREYYGICAIKESCDHLNRLIDSFSAYFLMPRSNINPLDLGERILSVPILGMAYIALRRKFERRK